MGDTYKDRNKKDPRLKNIKKGRNNVKQTLRKEIYEKDDEDQDEGEELSEEFWDGLQAELDEDKYYEEQYWGKEVEKADEATCDGDEET